MKIWANPIKMITVIVGARETPRKLISDGRSQCLVKISFVFRGGGRRRDFIGLFSFHAVSCTLLRYFSLCRCPLMDSSIRLGNRDSSAWLMNLMCCSG